MYPPIDAIRELARLSASCSSIAVLSFDLAFLDSLPSLEPLLPLSPALRVVAQLIVGRAILAARRVAARDRASTSGS